MSQDEFFAFMPLLIYGIAVSELIMHWRDYLKSQRRYWPHLLTGLMMLELAFLNFYYLYDKLELLFIDYYSFLFRLSSPLVLLLAVSVYTPESDRNVKEYFQDTISLIYALLGLFILLNMFHEFNFDMLNLIRFLGILVCAFIAITRKIWMIYLFLLLRISLGIVLEFFPTYIT